MTRNVIDVEEHVPRDFAVDELDASFAAALWSRYRTYVDVEFPSPKTSGRWRLTAKGCVGFLPIDDRSGLNIRPKVPVANLFRMLEYAYGLDSFHFLAGRFSCASLEEFYAYLAGELASRVLRRVRLGIYRAYAQVEERVAALRGQLDVWDHVRQPWTAGFRCRFDEHTIDNEENRLLGWALYLAARTVHAPQSTKAVVTRAFRALQGSVRIQQASSSACVNRAYTRLNTDYSAMHALCAFVIDHAGPQHARGEQHMLPFVVNMGRLFERFVSGVLSLHTNPQRTVATQERIRVDGDAVNFVLDVLVRDTGGRPVRVVDTKYKNVKSPSLDDVAQVVAYATAVGASEAVLVYPFPLRWHGRVGPVRVRTVGVRLDGDMNAVANKLTRELL